MKIYISKYRDNYISPYTIFERVFFWTEWSKCSRWTLAQISEDENREESLYVDYPEWVERWANRLTPISKLIKRVLDFIYPEIRYVKIDHWDTLNIDYTLANIVLPMLQQLQTDKQGAPNVDDEDVPEHLRRVDAEPDIDPNYFQRWDWILAEMIFAFEMKCCDDWKNEFRSGEIDWRLVPIDAKGNEVPLGQHRRYKCIKGPNDTYVYDAEGAKLVYDRISNGFRLFGKYYESLGR